MIVGSSASDHLLDDDLIPSLHDSMGDFEKIEKTKTLGTTGNEKAFATASK